jgi:hypothetical protein
METSSFGLMHVFCLQYARLYWSAVAALHDKHSCSAMVKKSS